MEKINIAELLKDCPKGMELDCVMFDNVTFDRVSICDNYPIIVKTPEGRMELNKYGQFFNNDFSKCIIFPKGKTTWDEFVPPCKFKVGDNIRIKGTLAIYVVTEIREDCYILDDKDTYLLFKNQDQWELVPDKFDINTLKPFDRVLVRLTNNCVWMPKFFSRYDSEMKCYSFIITDNLGYTQCIPYEGNEHLAGKTDDCDEYYKTWEEKA